MYSPCEKFIELYLTMCMLFWMYVLCQQKCLQKAKKPLGRDEITRDVYVKLEEKSDRTLGNT